MMRLGEISFGGPLAPGRGGSNDDAGMLIPRPACSVSTKV